MLHPSERNRDDNSPADEAITRSVLAPLIHAPVFFSPFLPPDLIENPP